MDQNVRYYWIQELAIHLYLDHTICAVSGFIHYHNLHLKHKEFKVGNGQFISVLFIIPVIVDIHGHRFEICTFVSEIHEKCRLSF